MPKRRSYRQVLEELTALNETLISAKDLTELYGQLTRRIAQITGARTCLITNYDSDSHCFVTQTPYFGANERKGIPLRYEVTPEKRRMWNFRLKGALLSNNALEDPRLDQKFTIYYSVKSVLLAPMIVQKELLGLIVMINKRGGFTQFDSYVASLIAYQAGVILTNARLMEEEKRRVKQIALLNETARQINSSLVSRDVAVYAINAVVNTLRKNEVGLYMPEPDDQTVRMTACVGPQHTKVLQEGYIQPVEAGLIGLAFRTRRTIVSNDCRDHPDFLSHPLMQTRSEVAIPIQHGDRVLAVLNVESPELNAFSPSDVSFLETLADHLAAAFHNAILYQEQKKHNDQMLLLSELVSEVALILDPKMIVRTAVDRIKQRFEYYFVALGWVDEKEQIIKDWYYLPRFEILEGNAGPPVVPLNSGLTGRAARTGKSVLVPDTKKDPDYYNILDQTRSELATPVKIGNTVVAVLDLQSDKENAFDESDRMIMETLAHALSTAIQNADSYERLQQINVQLADTSRMKDEIVQIVAHDFRSPLTVIRGYMDYLLKKAEWRSEKQREIMNTVSLQAQRLQKLAEATLKASRLDSGDISFSYEKLDFQVFLQRLIFPYSEKHQFVVNSEEHLPLIKADGGRLQEVIENLISNAVKYSPEGGIVEISARSVRGGDLPEFLNVSKDSNFLQVCVSDEGIGIPPEKRNRLFQRFSRLHENRRIEGIGLGLYITHKMLQSHGGKIWVEAREPLGSRFCFVIPAFEESPDSKTILLVDDDVHTLRLLHKTISDIGYDVVTAIDGIEALDRVPRHRPRLIVVDALMPGMSGEELIRRLRADPETASIPVIVFSGKPDFRLSREFSEIPIVSKNAGTHALIACIRQVLGKSPAAT